MKMRGLRRRKKAKNVLQGFEQGSLSLSAGVADGISGLAMHPYRSYQKEGFSGMLTGAIKGLAGLVTKPISGLLDTVSKTAEVGERHPGHREHGARQGG